VPKGEPKFATFRAKWDEQYRKKWGIRTGVAKPFPAAVEKKLYEVCKRIYRHLQIRAYGRIDLRVKDNGEIYFIEANPNPSIAKDDDFAMSAAKAGVDYSELISKILSLAF
jgi:D-alanine-D-alanine ligase